MKDIAETQSLEIANIRDTLLGRFCEGWGLWISCDNGWDWILKDLHKKLIFIDPNYQILQVKEKFGTLRFYVETKTEGVAKKVVSDLIALAEQWSSVTCEVCGNSNGKSNPSIGVAFDPSVALRCRSQYLVKTLCRGCAEGLEFDLLDSELLADGEKRNQ